MDFGFVILLFIMFFHGFQFASSYQRFKLPLTLNLKRLQVQEQARLKTSLSLSSSLSSQSQSHVSPVSVLVYSKGLHSRLGLPQKFLASGVSDRSKESGLILQQRVLSSNNNENGIGTERETEREREKTESGSGRGVLELELVWGPASGIKESPFFIDFSSSEMKKRLMKCKTELLVKTMGNAYAYAHADANIDANNNNNAIGSANVAEANTEGEGEGEGGGGGGGGAGG